MYLAVGLMSGTSMDGVDAALLATDGECYTQPLAHFSLKYPKDFQLLLKASELAVNEASGDLQQAADNLNHHLAVYLEEIMLLQPQKAHAKASTLIKDWRSNQCLLDSISKHSTHMHSQAASKLLQVSGYAHQQIHIVGYHGQTLYHAPHRGVTVQIGDGQALADALEIPVINHFRQQDVINGGQGAPLAPIYHQALAIQSNLIPLAIVNCGGIANITIISGKTLSDIQAFDTGAGNVLIDRYVKQISAGKEMIDIDGQYGLLGKVNSEVLAQLSQSAVITPDGSNYLDISPPKSLDSHHCRLIQEVFKLSREDACATLAAFTACSIANSLEHIAKPWPKHWVLAGGGWHNQRLLQEFTQRIRQKIDQSVSIMTAQQAGWNNAALEAECFAYLAVRSIRGLPLSTPQTTGVCAPMSGGDYYQPTCRKIDQATVCV